MGCFMNGENRKKAKFHLPGLFEFYDFYKVFLPIYEEHREYFYEWCEIASLYGAPEVCIWGGGRFGEGDIAADEILDFLESYGISARLTFSNSLLKEEHLSDEKCNKLCEIFSHDGKVKNGVIVHSELLLDYLKDKYPELYLVSSTTKVITDFDLLAGELDREEFEYVVPDFRFNNQFDKLSRLSQAEKDKVEFLVNECCDIGCNERKECYENVSRRMLDEDCVEHNCRFSSGGTGYSFAKAMESPAFIGVDDITDTYLPNGFSNFKIEGRGLGTAMLLEFLLYYLIKPECQMKVREAMYLDSMLDLF